MMMYMMRDNQVITSTDDPIVKYAPLFEVCLMKAPRSVNERIYTNTMAAAQSIQPEPITFMQMATQLSGIQREAPCVQGKQSIID
jgi:hypothetical protein